MENGKSKTLESFLNREYTEAEEREFIKNFYLFRNAKLISEGENEFTYSWQKLVDREEVTHISKMGNEHLVLFKSLFVSE